MRIVALRSSSCGRLRGVAVVGSVQVRRRRGVCACVRIDDVVELVACSNDTAVRGRMLAGLGGPVKHRGQRRRICVRHDAWRPRGGQEGEGRLGRQEEREEGNDLHRVISIKSSSSPRQTQSSLVKCLVLVLVYSFVVVVVVSDSGSNLPRWLWSTMIFSFRQ
jgi:hypothetical protein